MGRAGRGTGASFPEVGGDKATKYTMKFDPGGNAAEQEC